MLQRALADMASAIAPVTVVAVKGPMMYGGYRFDPDNGEEAADPPPRAIVAATACLQTLARIDCGPQMTSDNLALVPRPSMVEITLARIGGVAPALTKTWISPEAAS